MLKTTTVYYEQTDSNGNSVVNTKAVYLDFESEEQVIQQLTDKGFRIVTKKEFEAQTYKRVYPEIKKALEEGNIGEVLMYVKWNGNKVSMQAFRDITGIKLSPTMKVRIRQLKEYFGEKYSEYERKRAEDRARKLEEQEAKRQQEHKSYTESLLQKWNSGEFIPNSHFLYLCQQYGIELHPRTKGFVNKRISSVNNKGEYYKERGAKFSMEFYKAVRALIKATECDSQNL